VRKRVKGKDYSFHIKKEWGLGNFTFKFWKFSGFRQDGQGKGAIRISLKKQTRGRILMLRGKRASSGKKSN